MGIRGLSTALQPYAVSTTIGCGTSGCVHHLFTEDDQKASVIIDGPALAYCIYYRLYQGRPGHADGLEALPSYHHFGRAALLFLSALEDYGMNIEKIFFDGCLPSRKQAIRVERLENTIKQRFGFKSNQKPRNSQAKVENNWDAELSSPSLVLSPSPPMIYRSGRQIALPFLVPALMDSVSQSKFRVVGSIVPGEADVYCAQLAREHGGIILTNDSDLLVYDLGPNGSVAFLNDLTFPSDVNGQQAGQLSPCDVFGLSIFQPKSIAQRLGLMRIQSLAYAYKENGKRKHTFTLPEAIARAKEIDHAPSGFTKGFPAFLNEYRFDIFDLRGQRVLPIAVDHYRSKTNLDPRVSEYVLQVVVEKEEKPEVYLPTLVDDPSRSSAWSVSMEHRSFVYSILMSTDQGNSKTKAVQEYDRKGQRIRPQQFSILSEAETVFHASKVLDQLQKFTYAFSEYPNNFSWRAYALADVYRWYLNTGKVTPSRPTMLAVMTGFSLSQPNWEQIHLSAQIQAVLYSLRMIQQILDYAITTTPFTVPPELSDLAAFLQDLPQIAQLMPSTSELSALTEDLDMEEFLNLIAKILGDEYSADTLEDVDEGAWESPMDDGSDGIITDSALEQMDERSSKSTDERARDSVGGSAENASMESIEEETDSSAVRTTDDKVRSQSGEAHGRVMNGTKGRTITNGARKTKRNGKDVRR